MIRLCYLVLAFLYCVPVMAQVAKMTDTSKIFKAVDIFLEPRDGMNGFKVRWLNYLKETMKEGRLDKTIYADHMFEVLVAKDGSLLERKSGSKDLILHDFLRVQKKWKPGIRSGLPIFYLLKLKVPKELFDQVAIEELVAQEDLVKQELLKE
ncbi:MAG: hypothetical protein LBF27_17260 [Sphingobacterium sp.]|nr:hypothetical protein [Sphingobacterium sp.]